MPKKGECSSVWVRSAQGNGEASNCRAPRLGAQTQGDAKARPKNPRRHLDPRVPSLGVGYISNEVLGIKGSESLCMRCQAALRRHVGVAGEKRRPGFQGPSVGEAGGGGGAGVWSGDVGRWGWHGGVGEHPPSGRCPEGRAAMKSQGKTRPQWMLSASYTRVFSCSHTTLASPSSMSVHCL